METQLDRKILNIFEGASRTTCLIMSDSSRNWPSSRHKKQLKNQYFRSIFSAATDGKIISNSIFDQNRFHKAQKIEYPFIFIKVYVNRFIRSSCIAPRAPKNTVFRKTHSKFEVTRFRVSQRFRSTSWDFINILYMKISFYPRVFNTSKIRIMQETKKRFFHRQVLQPPLKGRRHHRTVFL